MGGSSLAVLISVVVMFVYSLSAVLPLSYPMFACNGTDVCYVTYNVTFCM